MKYLTLALLFLALFFSNCRTEEDEMVVTPIDTTKTPTDTTTHPWDLNPFLIEPGSRTMVVAHRGGRDLAPENTMAAFDNAVSLGVDVLEMDVVMTKDSILVTIHDLSIDRTCDTAGLVQDFTFQELQQFNFGYEFKDANGDYPYRSNPVRIPRIEDVLDRYATELMMIEIKDLGKTGIAAARKLNALIEARNLQQQIGAFSFVDSVKISFPDIFHEDIYLGASLGDGFQFVAGTNAGDDLLIAALPVDILAFPLELGALDLTDSTFIEAAHRNNLPLHYWTIDKKEDMEMLISKGADGIMTDKPDLLISTLQEMGFD